MDCLRKEMKMLWHYTVGRHLNEYVEAMQITTNSIEVSDDPTDLIWLSMNSIWEPQGFAAIQRKDGTFVRPNKEQLSAIAHGLFRIGIEENDAQTDWATFVRRPRINRDAVNAIEELAIDAGANKADWRLEFQPIPQRKWTSLERWDGKESAWVSESLAGSQFEASAREMFDAIEGCIPRRQVIASLVLIYSTIDSLAWLAIPDLDSPTSEKHFCGWLDTYLLPYAMTIRCDSIDFYGARCGVLHTRSPISNKSLSKKAKQIMYAWGSHTQSQLQRRLDQHPTESTIAVHIGELYAALRSAFDRFRAALSNDPVQSRLVRAKSTRSFPSAEDSFELSKAIKELGL